MVEDYLTAYSLQPTVNKQTTGDTTMNNTNHYSGSLLTRLRLVVADRAASAGNSQEAYEVMASSWGDDQYLELIAGCTAFSRVETKLLKVIYRIDKQLAQAEARARTINWIYSQHGAVFGTTLHNEFVEWFALNTKQVHLAPIEDIRLKEVINFYYTCLRTSLAHYK